MKSIFKHVLVFSFTIVSISFAQEKGKIVAVEASSVEVVMSISDFLGAVRKSYLDIKTKKKEANAAIYNYQEYFYPKNMPNVGLSYKHTGADFSDDKKNRTDSVDAFVDQPLSISGTDLKLGYQHSFTDNQYASVSQGQVPGKNNAGSLYLGITQSVLNGGPLMLQDYYRQSSLREKITQSKIDFNAQLEEVLYNAMKTYYDYQYALMELALAEESLRDSQRIYLQNQRKGRYGAIEKYNLYDSRVFVEQSTNNLEQMKITVRDLKNQLFIYLGEKELGEKVDAKVTLTDALVFKPESFDFERALENTVLQRNDLRSLRSSIRVSELNLKVARGNYMPILDFSANVNFRDLDKGGNKRKPIGWDVGFTFRAPILPQSYKLVTSRARNDYAIAQERYDIKLQNVKAEVDRYIRTLTSQLITVKNLEETLRLRTDSLSERRKKFDNGKMDLEDYLRYYDTVRESKRAYFSAIETYELNKARFQIIQGNFLDKYRVEAEKPFEIQSVFKQLEPL